MRRDSRFAGRGRVRLNQYQTRTDAKGRYLFRNIPEGEYDLSLDGKQPARRLQSRAAASIHLTLNGDQPKKNQLEGFCRCDTIAGRVASCWKKAMAKADALDLSGIPICAGRFCQLRRGKDGSFAFYNLEPGPHTIRLLDGSVCRGGLRRWRRPLKSQSLCRSTARFPDVAFRIKTRDKDILFQDN